MLMRICARCGRKVPQGEKCPCSKQRHQAYDREHRDREKAEFYSSWAWKSVARAARARAGYADEYLLAKEGRLGKGGIIHHIQPIDERPERRLDMGNLICVSYATHEYIHQEYAAGKERKKEMQRILFEIRAARPILP